MSVNIQYFFVIWLPALVLIAQSFLEVLTPEAQLAALHSEYGPHEMVQSLVIGAAALVALRLLFMSETRQSPWLIGWVFIAFVAAVYVTGEELSWGQHVFEWRTPEYWQNLNDQGETNLHNTSSWLDQKPRIMLEIGVLVGGIVIPLLRRFQVSLPQKFSLIYPTDHVFTTALMALIVTIIDKIGGIMERPSEVEEFYLFYFVLLYLVYLRKKLLSKA